MRAILVNRFDTGYCADLCEVDESQLPEGDVTVRVGWSTLNFKDNDEDIWDIAGITAFFGLSNGMANFMSMRPNNEFFTMGRDQ